MSEVRWQGCAEAGLCYLPQITKLQLTAPIDIDKPLTDADLNDINYASDQLWAEALIANNYYLNLLLLLGLGILLSFTPCVLPMLPILSSLIVGAKDSSRSRGFLLSLAYVTSMASTYAVVGTVAAATGANLQIAFQNPWVLSSFAAIMLLLALAMFTSYNFQMPSVVMQWADSKSRNAQQGSIVGTASMGALSALLVGPCVAPPLVGIIIFIGQTGDLLTGASALFALGFGMGIPLLIFGSTLSSWLPKVSAWSRYLNPAFGFMLLGVALWFLDRVLSTSISTTLWALWALSLAVWLLWLAYNQYTTERKRLQAFIILLVTACFLVVSTQQLLFVQGYKWNLDKITPFEPDYIVTTIDEFENIRQTSTSNLIVDLYATWCIDCLRIERNVLPASSVQKAITDNNWQVIRFDITSNNEHARQFLKEYSILGAPTLLFFPVGEEEHRHLRQIGYVDAEELAPRLQR